jgi:hypothetical protein
MLKLRLKLTLENPTERVLYIEHFRALLQHQISNQKKKIWNMSDDFVNFKYAVKCVILSY